MHEDVAGIVPLPNPQVCADCGGERKAGAGRWGEVHLCGKCHKEAPGLREVLQLKSVIVLAEVARQLWGGRGHRIARSLAVWKRVGEILQGERRVLWTAGVEVVRQVGNFRPQAIPPTEWSTIWHQLPCRLRVYAVQIEEEWQRAMPLEYGTGPAELQALQEMAALWWQDTQHGHRQGGHSEAGANTEIRMRVGTGEAATGSLDGTWQRKGEHGGGPVWRHTERHLHLYLSPSGRWVVGREVGSGKGVAVSQAHSPDLGQLGQQSRWQIYNGNDWVVQVVSMWGGAMGRAGAAAQVYPPPHPGTRWEASPRADATGSGEQ